MPVAARSNVTLYQCTYLLFNSLYILVSITSKPCNAEPASYVRHITLGSSVHSFLIICCFPVSAFHSLMHSLMTALTALTALSTPELTYIFFEVHA